MNPTVEVSLEWFQERFREAQQQTNLHDKLMHKAQEKGNTGASRFHEEAKAIWQKKADGYGLLVDAHEDAEEIKNV